MIPKAAKPVTTVDIARHLGVSQPAVSTVLNGGRNNTRVSDKLRTRVLAAAQEMGYRPNSAARTIRTGKHHAIGILRHSDPSSGGISLLLQRNILEALEDHDMPMVMSLVSREKLTDPQTVPRLMREWRVDGMLVSYTTNPPPILGDLIENSGTPAVWINIKRDHDCIRPDDFDAGRRGTQMLLDAGHRRIAYVTGRPQTEPPLDHYSVYDRRDGYRAAMAEAGLEPVQVDAPRGETSAQQIAQARDILTGPDRPTAIFIVRGDATVATWIGAAMSLGLQVPRDLSIVGLAEWNIDVLGHQVSSMKLPQREVGRGAVEMVLSKADRPQQPLESRVMPFRVNQGQTIHPPRPST